MTHQYQLHADLLAECLCCHALQPFHFDSASAQVVCSFCVRHIGLEKAERRDADHVRLWAELHAEAQESHRDVVTRSEHALAERDGALAELRLQVDELTELVAGAFDQTRTGGVRQLLETEIVRRAERKAELEYRRNDRLMDTLWRLSLLHRVDAPSPAACVCGTPSVACAELKAIEPMRQSLVDWDRRHQPERPAPA